MPAGPSLYHRGEGDQMPIRKILWLVDVNEGQDPIEVMVVELKPRTPSSAPIRRSARL
jgi:hypothetical protein